MFLFLLFPHQITVSPDRVKDPVSQGEMINPVSKQNVKWFSTEKKKLSKGFTSL